jgi:hypothetical protein
MQLKAIALALPLLALQTAGFAQTMEKNGLPCVEEVCLGDGLAELAKISWLPAHSLLKANNKVQSMGERKLADDDLRTLKAAYPISNEAAPFLFEKQFDATALKALAGVPAACEVNVIFGSYGTDARAPTKVGLSLMPSPADASRQAWVVTSIVREFPTAVANEVRVTVTEELKRRYGKYGAGGRDLPNAKPGEGRFFLGGMSNFGFGLSMTRAPDEAARLKANPMCTAK